jgi:hypothetical protein
MSDPREAQLGPALLWITTFLPLANKIISRRSSVTQHKELYLTAHAACRATSAARNTTIITITARCSKFEYAVSTVAKIPRACPLAYSLAMVKLDWRFFIPLGQRSVLKRNASPAALTHGSLAPAPDRPVALAL